MKFPSLIAKLDRLPPSFCRLLARRRIRKMKGRGSWIPASHADIAKASDLPRSTVADLSRQSSWANVPLTVADRFAKACGVNLADIDAAIARLRAGRNRLTHLPRGQHANQRRFINAVLQASTSISISTTTIPHHD